jgi:hypothetical protein
MEYLFVLIALATFGLVFAGLKTLGGTNRKNITRLQL